MRTLWVASLSKNRGELGRQLNVATDYIIMDGYLDGSIVPGDEGQMREFTIPFNIVNGKMKGSLFWTKDFKYPLPIMPRIELSREGYDPKVRLFLLDSLK